MSTDSITLASLTASHIADLRAVAANPRHVLQPQRRDLLKRLGLIVPTEPPRSPRMDGVLLRGPRPRAHALTPLGVEVEARAPAETARGLASRRMATPVVVGELQNVRRFRNG